MTRIGWYNRNRTGNTPKYESYRHGLAAKGIKTALPKGSKCVTLCAGTSTPNFDMVSKGDNTLTDYLKFSKKNVLFRLYNVPKIKDENLLRKIAYRDPSMFVRALATRYITDQDTLKGIALANETTPAGVEAVYKIKDIEFLKNLERRAVNKETSRYVAVRDRLIKLLDAKKKQRSS
ncbi:hypothetical protein DRN76_04880 [Methanosarcinales archaeon]|nr:MAG: hypothetical protein DRN76_04880 [Methanosarcinales archaeon]